MLSERLYQHYENRFDLSENLRRADTPKPSITAANAAATGRITNFPVSIITSSARDVAAKNKISIPANTAGVKSVHCTDRRPPFSRFLRHYFHHRLFAA